MFRKKMPPEPPSRVAHPDPRKEAQLQEIITLRRIIERDQALADERATQIAYAEKQAVRVSCHSVNQCDEFARQASKARRALADTNMGIRNAHREIAALMAEIDDNDLAYL